MATKIAKSSKADRSNSKETGEHVRATAQSEAKLQSKLQSVTRKGLSRQEKLEAVRKANQALLQVLKSMSQRDIDAADAKSDI